MIRRSDFETEVGRRVRQPHRRLLRRRLASFALAEMGADLMMETLRELAAGGSAVLGQASSLPGIAGLATTCPSGRVCPA